MTEVLADRAKAATPASAPVTALTRKVEDLVRRLAAAERQAHGAQVREALTRTELGLALAESLAARADLRAEADRRAIAQYREARRAAPKPGLRGRLDRGLDRLLVRGGWPGQALLIARSGLWPKSGGGAIGGLRDLRRMAGHARRGADASLPSPSPVAQGWYLARYPDVAACGLSALGHYLSRGAAEQRQPNPLFDPIFYQQRNAAALAATGLPALAHFIHFGAAEGLDPHPLFSVAHYVAQDAEAARAPDPTTHYLEHGWMRGLSPHPLFDAEWYRARMPGGEAADTPPLAHYLTFGWTQGLKPNPLFDPAWYLDRYPDVAAAGFEPLSHFALAGAADGRDPGPWFDIAHYVAARGEAATYHPNPLADYLLGGAWRVGEPRPGFAATAYLVSQPGLAARGVTPLAHWASLAGD